MSATGDVFGDGFVRRRHQPDYSAKRSRTRPGHTNLLVQLNRAPPGFLSAGSLYLQAVTMAAPGK